MMQDRRRLALRTARLVKNLTLREAAELVSKSVGFPISHQTLWNLERDCEVDTKVVIKAAICLVYGLDHFPEGPPATQEAVTP